VATLDKKAMTILFDTFWTQRGWKAEAERKVSAEDLAYAKQHGVMFDPVRLDHTTVISRLKSALAKIEPAAVGGAFLASLTAHRLDWRSAFGSYVVFSKMRNHTPKEARSCGYCGMYLNDSVEDLNLLNFERLKWGGVRHSSPEYARFDLELFLENPPPAPTPADIAVFEALLDAIDAAPAGTTSGALQRRFPKGLKSNKPERDVLIGLLGFCGALGTPDHPGFSAQFVPVDGRVLPPRRFVDMAYPACWWQREAGLNRAALKPYFGAFTKAV
jgi:hypothetical protein